MRSLHHFLPLLLLFASLHSQAQDQIITAPAIAESLTKNLEGHLQLEGDQLQQVDQINQKYARELADLRTRNASHPEKGGAAKKLLADYDAAMKEALTPGQYQQFQQLKDEQLKQLYKAGLHRSTARLAEELDLSEEQIAQVTTINEKYAPEIRTIRESGEPGRNKMRQLQAINGERNEELKDVFSAEQYARYQVLQSEMLQRRRN